MNIISTSKSNNRKWAVAAFVLIVFSLLMVGCSGVNDLNLAGTGGGATGGEGGAQDEIIGDPQPTQSAAPETGADENPAQGEDVEVVAPAEVAPALATPVGQVVYLVKVANGGAEIVLANADGSGEPVTNFISDYPPTRLSRRRD